MEEKSYLITFESEEIADRIKPLLEEKGLVLEKMLKQTLLPGFTYIYQYHGKPENLEEVLGHARTMKEIYIIEENQTKKAL